MIRKIRNMLSLFLVAAFVFSGTITAHAASVDDAAESYFNLHSYHADNECGAVIRSNGTLGPVYQGAPHDVIDIILDGLGVTVWQHSSGIRAIAARYASLASNDSNYNKFKAELDDYVSQNNLEPYVTWPISIAGIVHCHPNGTLLSPPDKYLSRYLGIPIYVATGSSGQYFYKFHGHSFSSIGDMIAWR